MLSDAPRYVRRRVKEETDGQEIDTGAAADEARNIVSFYQSKLEL